jgi:hypothetical protein
MTRFNPEAGQVTLVLVLDDGTEMEVDIPPVRVEMNPVYAYSRREPFDDTNPIQHRIGTHTILTVTLPFYAEAELLQHFDDRRFRQMTIER